MAASAYIETHEPDTYAGHFRLHLPADRTVEVTFTLDLHRFSEVERILRIIFGAKL